MIQIGDTTINLSDPSVQLILMGAVLMALVLFLLVLAVRRAGRSAAMMAPLLRDMSRWDSGWRTCPTGKASWRAG